MGISNDESKHIEQLSVENLDLNFVIILANPKRMAKKKLRLKIKLCALIRYLRLSEMRKLYETIIHHVLGSSFGFTSIPAEGLPEPI